MFIPPIKTPFIFALALVLNSFTGQAQSNISYRPEFQPKAIYGPVKNMSISKRDLGNTPNASTTILSFDKYGRIIKEKENSSDPKVCLYADQKSVKPILTSYIKAKPGQQEYTLSEFDGAGRQVLSADIEAGKVSNLDVYTFQADKEERKMFVNTTEIYNHTKAVALNLSTKNFPAGFAPFQWDRQVSTGFEETSTSFDNRPAEHIYRFKLVEKGNPANWVEFSYNADDVYDAGKGQWYRYANRQKTQERYISGNSLSDFGHLLQYDAKGRMIKDTYGYFNKIPQGDFMQQEVYTYDQHGQLIKRENTSDGKKGDPVVYSYQYDEKGNWTSCINKYKDGSGTKFSRVISYYGDNEASLSNGLSLQQYQSLLTQAKQQVILSEKKYLEFLSAKVKLSKGPQKNINYRSLMSMNWKDFLPENNKLDTMCRGDLNKDGLEDIVFVYQPKKLLEHQQNTTRTLRILLKQPNGQYRLAAEGPHTVFPEDANNVYFSGISIDKGILIIEHEYLRGGCTYKYRYQQGGFYLIGASSYTGDPSYTYHLDYNLSTGQYVISYQYDDEKDKSNVKKGVKKLNPLPNIETFEPYSIKIGDNSF